MTTIKNKGTGAGGKGTNLSGLPFETKTSIIPELEKLKFEKKIFGKGETHFYFSKEIGTKKIYFLHKNGFQKFVKDKYNKIINRQPDEAYIIEDKDKITIKILEKKNQNGSGTAWEKVLAGPMIKMGYQVNFGKDFTIDYSYCIATYIKNILDDSFYDYYKNYCSKENINIFLADEPDYFNKVLKWILDENNKKSDEKCDTQLNEGIPIVEKTKKRTKKNKLDNEIDELCNKTKNMEI